MATKEKNQAGGRCSTTFLVVLAVLLFLTFIIWRLLLVSQSDNKRYPEYTFRATRHLLKTVHRARDLLAKVAYADVSNEAFAFSTAREFFIGRVKCRVNRMNYVGELGFEIFHPIESQIPLFKTLMETGAEFDLKMFGMYAMESMRLEKGYLAWKAEMNVHHTPLETNIDWTVKWDKDFIGKQSLEKVKADGVALKLACMVIEAEDSDPWGYNPIFKSDEQVGMTSSGGYGHRVGKSIALGYIKPELAEPGTSLEVEVLGKKLPAEVMAMPLYDSENKKMKG